MEPLLTARDVARMLRRHPNWVYARATAGDLPSYRLGGTRRFARDEVLAWLRTQRDGQGTGAPR